MKHSLHFIFFLVLVSSFFSLGNAQTPNYNALSEDFIKSLMNKSSVESHLQSLAEAQPKILEQQLDTDQKRKAFWINVYNGLVISKLSQSPELFENRGSFFSSKQFVIAGKEVSLDKIEHGIIRRSRKKLSLGYLKKWFPSRFEKRFWVDEIDGRVHYALNCGAKSCPPVRIYTAHGFDAEVDASAKTYLQKHVKFEEAQKEVYVPVLFSWFIGDFGGKDGVRDFLVHYELLNENNKTSYALKYLNYDWTLDINNFQTILLSTE